MSLTIGAATEYGIIYYLILNKYLLRILYIFI